MRVDYASLPARPDRANEDHVAANGDAVVLVDGAGTPAGSQSGCVHGVAWYAAMLSTALLSRLNLGQGRDLSALLGDAIDHVRWMHADTCDLTHPGSPSATVVAVRREGEKLAYLVLADSVLVLDRVGAEPCAITDDREARVGRTLRGRMDALPSGTPEHDAAHRAYVEALRDHRNREGGFWVAAADPAAAGQALTGVVPLAELRAVALLSDGASRLVDRFALATWRQALDLLADAGPTELLRRVRTAEDSDPRGERWPRGKVHDDATAAYCRLDGAG